MAQQPKVMWEFKDRKGRLIKEEHFEGEPITLEILKSRYLFHSLVEIRIAGRWYRIPNICKSKRLPQTHSRMFQFV